MQAKEFAERLKADLQGIQRNGSHSVPIEGLIKYLDDYADAAPGADQETLRMQAIEAFKHNAASSLESFKSVIQAGQNAIRSMILINGGASVAVLAFLGHMARIDPSAVQTFAAILPPFAAGTLAGGLVSGFTYLSQWLYGHETKWAVRGGYSINLIAIALGIGSFAAFGIGSWWTYDAFANIPVTPLDIRMLPAD